MAPRIAAVIALLVACGTQEQAPAQPQPPAPPAIAPAAATAPAPAAAPPPTKLSLTRAELQHLFDAWLQAQNAGDFVAYEALYAPEMRGVKRVGTRESSFDRAGWMKDRARMFRKKIEVGAHDLRFSGQAGAAQLDFVQVFRSGSFMDSGPKRLTVVKRDGAARILREEMLASEVSVPAGAMLDRIYLLFSAGDRSFVVLEETADASWGTGQFALDPHAELSVYSQDVDPAKVPAGEKWLRSSWRVHGQDGSTCTSGVERLELLVIAEYPEALLDEKEELWRGLTEVERDDARARHLQSFQPAILVGKLAQCAGAFATPAAQPEPALFRPQPAGTMVADDMLKARILSTTKALPKYRALQSEWEAILGSEVDGEPPIPRDRIGAWASSSSVSVFSGPSGTWFATALFSRSDEGGPFTAQLMAVYRFEADQLVLVSAGPTSADPTLLVDVNRDGTPELFSGGDLAMVYAVGSAGLYVLKLVPHYYGGCGC